jgi:DNA-directed RNA polymerase subunit H (RpoH/RPB5)
MSIFSFKINSLLEDLDINEQEITEITRDNPVANKAGSDEIETLEKMKNIIGS